MTAALMAALPATGAESKLKPRGKRIAGGGSLSGKGRGQRSRRVEGGTRSIGVGNEVAGGRRRERHGDGSQEDR